MKSENWGDSRACETPSFYCVGEKSANGRPALNCLASDDASSKESAWLSVFRFPLSTYYKLYFAPALLETLLFEAEAESRE